MGSGIDSSSSQILDLELGESDIGECLWMSDFSKVILRRRMVKSKGMD